MAAYGRGKVSEFLKPEEGLMAAVGKSNISGKNTFHVTVKNF